MSVSAPSYAEHSHHWARYGHTMRALPYCELDDAVRDSDVVVVINPNNPTGETVAPERLLAWHAELAARGGWLVVDQAFGDTAPTLSVAAHADKPGLIVLHSIGKFFGLAGLRLGFVAAEAPPSAGCRGGDVTTFECHRRDGHGLPAGHLGGWSVDQLCVSLPGDLVAPLEYGLDRRLRRGVLPHVAVGLRQLLVGPVDYGRGRELSRPRR